MQPGRHIGRVQWLDSCQLYSNNGRVWPLLRPVFSFYSVVYRQIHTSASMTNRSTNQSIGWWISINEYSDPCDASQATRRLVADDDDEVDGDVRRRWQQLQQLFDRSSRVTSLNGDERRRFGRTVRLLLLLLVPLEAGTHGFRSVAPTATRPQLKLAGAIERTRPSTVPSHRLAAGAYCGLMISRPVMIEQVTTARRNETSVACVARAMIGAASAIDAGGGGGAVVRVSSVVC
jgi:hypothetical protein